MNLLAVGHLLGRPHAGASSAPCFATSLPFDIAHALGNAVFCLAFGPALVRALQRFRTRFEVTWRPAPAAAAASPRRWSRRSRRCMPRRRRRAADVPAQVGRVPRARAEPRRRARAARPARRSTQMHTGWAALGLAAAGRNPRDVSAAATTSSTTSARTRRALRGDLGERSRTILALRAAGVSPTRVRRPRPARASCCARRRATARSPAASTRPRSRCSRCARPGAPRTTARCAAGAAFIAGQANDDGGFNFAGKRRAVGRRRHRRRAAGARRGRAGAARASCGAQRDWLESRQNADGGFALQGGAEQRAVDGVGGPGPDRGRPQTRRACTAAARARRSATCARS